MEISLKQSVFMKSYLGNFVCILNCDGISWKSKCLKLNETMDGKCIIYYSSKKLLGLDVEGGPTETVVLPFLKLSFILFMLGQAHVPLKQMETKA